MPDSPKRPPLPSDAPEPVRVPKVDPVRTVARLLLACDPMSSDLDELFALDGDPLLPPAGQ